jgi:hypothetical protein
VVPSRNISRVALPRSNAESLDAHNAGTAERGALYLAISFAAFFAAYQQRYKSKIKNQQADNYTQYAMN